MNSTIGTLLQLTVTLLLGVQRNPAMSLAAREQAVSVGSRVVQLSAQDLANISFSVPPDSSAWPNITDLQNAPYLNAQNKWVQLGNGVTLVSTSTSFGDLNGDGLDDAAALVQTALPDGTLEFSLAAFLNQGGILFNIADVPLGDAVQMYSHSISNGALVVDMQEGGGAREVRHYTLLGDELSENP